MNSVNQRLPSGPAVIRSGCCPTPRQRASKRRPASSVRPGRWWTSVYQMLPSGPAARTDHGRACATDRDRILPEHVAVGVALADLVEVGLGEPEEPAQRHDVIGAGAGVVVGNSVTVPDGVHRPIFDAAASTNQRLSSGPTRDLKRVRARRRNPERHDRAGHGAAAASDSGGHPAGARDSAGAHTGHAGAPLTAGGAAAGARVAAGAARRCPPWPCRRCRCRRSRRRRRPTPPLPAPALPPVRHFDADRSRRRCRRFPRPRHRHRDRGGDAEPQPRRTCIRRGSAWRRSWARTG